VVGIIAQFRPRRSRPDPAQFATLEAERVDLRKDAEPPRSDLQPSR
jgi:hypothetical protein